MTKEEWLDPKNILSIWEKAEKKDIFELYGPVELELFMKKSYYDKPVCGWDYAPQEEPMFRGEYFVLYAETESRQGSIESILNHDFDTLQKYIDKPFLVSRKPLWEYLWGQEDADKYDWE